MTKLFPVFLLALAFYGADVQSTEVTKKDIQPIGGFILYRVVDYEIEYLLLKRAKEDNWSPPKGKEQDNESVLYTAIRETHDETALNVYTDYQVLIPYIVYFEYYETKDNVRKQVHLWPAKLTNLEKPIQLSPKLSEYVWLPFDQAVARIRGNYRDGLIQGDHFIQMHEDLPDGSPYAYNNAKK